MITTDVLNSHQVLWLENDHLQVAILPGKGADIPLLHHRPSGVQFLMQTPSGLQPPGANLPSDFLENYEGGWQELFPNCGDGCQVYDAILPMHGEAAILAWEYEVLNQNELHLSVHCRQTPFQLERWMRLGGDTLEVEGCVTNLGTQSWPFIWGQHLVLGGDFLEEGCWLDMPASHITTPPRQYEPTTSRLADAQSETWPYAHGRQAWQQFDLRQIPGPDAHSHDDAIITGFQEGCLRVTNQRKHLKFSLNWDATVFPYLTMWMPYGGAELQPLTGIYGLGIEPWMYYENLANALACGQAKMLAPKQIFRTQWVVKIEQFRN